MLAAGAAILFLGVAVVVPLSSTSNALADQDFYARIHQQYVAPVSDAVAFDVTISPVEKLPDPKPEPAAVAGAASAPAAPPRYTGGGSPAEWMAAAGIAESDWGYVDFIASKESGWNPNATNSSSGACGLVQALPCSKVPGSGYDPVDNLRWATGYAVGRYGSWEKAYAFWQFNHWW